MRIQKLLSLLAAGLLLAPLSARAEITFDGTVVAGDAVSVAAPFGGMVSDVAVKAGSEIALGDAICTIETTKVYAPTSGTVCGLFGQPGDAVDTVTQRYGAVLYLSPVEKYTISASINKAYNSSETRYVTIGETVYISCTADGKHTATGVITGAEGTNYTVETTSGELLMEETVAIYRSADLDSESRLGQGTVSRTAETPVTGSGSILRVHVSEGEQVERGQLLFETVNGSLDGLYATDNQVVSQVSGIVAQLNASVGATVNKGDALLTVYPRESLQVEISVNEYDLAEIAEGDTVRLSFTWDEDAAETVTGTVEMISHVSSSETGEAAYKAYISFEPPAQTRLGMTVMATTGSAEYASAAAGMNCRGARLFMQRGFCDPSQEHAGPWTLRRNGRKWFFHRLVKRSRRPEQCGRFTGKGRIAFRFCPGMEGIHWAKFRFSPI